MSDIKLAPSILAADNARLGSEVEKVEKEGVEYLHIDIMDGHFVPNLSFSADTVRALRKNSNLVFDVHLMIENPEKYIKSFAEAGADIITVHEEAVENPRKIAEKIHRLGVSAGISVKPKTPIEKIKDCFQDFDLVLIMTVEPGFGGQSYIGGMNEKIRIMRDLINKSGKTIDLEVDGGINAENIAEPVCAGADVIVAGSAIFKADSIKAAISEMRFNIR